MADLTKDSPFPARFLGWMNERFPFSHGILFFILYATAVTAGRLSTNPETIEFGLREVIGFLPAWCFFLMLRVFDEHKDYELDCQNYPDRVLQSGLITLGHLKVAGGFAIATQFAGSLWLDQGFGLITYWWLATFAYSLLMAKEFFIGEWLEKRLTLYAVSHMVVMPIAMMWFAQIGAGASMLTPEVGLLAGLSFLSGGSFEVTRKLRGPEEERDEVQSYTQVMGIKGSTTFIFVLLMGSAGVQAGLLHWIFQGAPAFWWYLLLLIGPAIALITLVKFAKEPSAKTRKANEGSVSLAMLLSYVVVVSAIIAKAGITWA